MSKDVSIGNVIFNSRRIKTKEELQERKNKLFRWGILQIIGGILFTLIPTITIYRIVPVISFQTEEAFFASLALLTFNASPIFGGTYDIFLSKKIKNNCHSRFLMTIRFASLALCWMSCALLLSLRHSIADGDIFGVVIVLMLAGTFISLFIMGMFLIRNRSFIIAQRGIVTPIGSPILYTEIIGIEKKKNVTEEIVYDFKQKKSVTKQTIHEYFQIKYKKGDKEKTRNISMKLANKFDGFEDFIKNRISGRE